LTFAYIGLFQINIIHKRSIEVKMSFARNLNKSSKTLIKNVLELFVLQLFLHATLHWLKQTDLNKFLKRVYYLHRLAAKYDNYYNTYHNFFSNRLL